MIEVLMQVRKDKYKDNPILPEGLDLVEEEEQITHEIQLEEDLKVEEGLSTYPFWCMNLRSTDLLQTFSSLTQITLKTRKSTKGSRLRSSGKAPPMRSQDQRRAIARTMTKVRSRIHSLPHCLSMFQPFPRKRVLKTVPKLISLICAG